MFSFLRRPKSTQTPASAPVVRVSEPVVHSPAWHGARLLPADGRPVQTADIGYSEGVFELLSAAEQRKLVYREVAPDGEVSWGLTDRGMRLVNQRRV